MSKYYKEEDVISFLNTHCPKDMWEYQIADLPTIDIVTCKDCKRCEKELVIERRADGKEADVNLCNKTSPPTIVPLDFYCKDGAKMKGAEDE